MQPHEQLEKFFTKLIPYLKANPAQVSELMFETEAAFERAGYREEISEGVENILIVRLDAIGDMILMSGFIREVRANFPKARITLVVHPRTYPVVELCPYVNEILFFDVHAPVKNHVELLERIATFCRDNLWQKKFSVAFSPRWDIDTFSTLLMIWLSGARERVGYGMVAFNTLPNEPPEEIASINNFLLTKNIYIPRTDISDAEKNFYLLRASGFNVNQTHMELFYNAEDFQQAKEMLEDLPPSVKKVILALGAQEANRKYPVEKYLVALKELVKKDLVFIIVGGQAEFDAANFIERNLPQGKVLNLVGKITLRQCEAVTAQADFYLSNVTGNMHIAAAAQLPLICLYREAPELDDTFHRGSEFRRFPPYQTKFIALRPAHRLGECATLPPYYGGCYYNVPHCITQITPQEIIDAFEVLETL